LQLPDDSDVNAIARNQVFVKKMKFGRLHRCKNCGQYWFLDDEGVILWRVNADMTDLLFQWDNTSLLPNKAPIKSLQKIGSSQITRDESINIPCGIITKTGEFIEPASVEFSKFPPLSGNPQETILGCDILKIVKTDFALPLEVRKETQRAREIHMGYAPTEIEVHGYIFILNGAEDFFGHYGFKGSEVSLPSMEKFGELYKETEKKFGDLLVDNNTLPPVNVVYFDWFKGCESLFYNELT